MSESDVIEIQQGIPALVELTIYEDENADPLVPLNISLATVFVSVEKLTDFRQDDSEALISSKITVHIAPLVGRTNWEMTGVETLKPLGTYKADVRVYFAADELFNSSMFYIKIVPIVTHRVS